MNQSKLTSLLILIFTVVTPYTQVFSEDRIEMQGTAIIGNQELPKVLYIVPWKQSELPNITDQPLESLIDDALAPVDRESFRRQLDYYNALSETKN
ncbi:MAG: hypothetical protein OQK76_11365 [Gammaproteobacteria bacterium]|nr:hypothetical protein [Gammaproteobacteria bacterium]MCW8911204.1 hypothetical protein [Gammaproteobacteria bacterium]